MADFGVAEWKGTASIGVVAEEERINGELQLHSNDSLLA
jgi:hypothetical protein